MAKTTISRRRRAAYHESGHALMRFIHHLPIKEVSIVPNKDRGTLGHCRGGKYKFRRSRKLGVKAKAYLEKLVVVAL